MRHSDVLSQWLSCDHSPIMPPKAAGRDGCPPVRPVIFHAPLGAGPARRLPRWCGRAHLEVTAPQASGRPRDRRGAREPAERRTLPSAGPALRARPRVQIATDARSARGEELEANRLRCGASSARDGPALRSTRSARRGCRRLWRERSRRPSRRTRTARRTGSALRAAVKLRPRSLVSARTSLYARAPPAARGRVGPPHDPANASSDHSRARVGGEASAHLAADAFPQRCASHRVGRPVWSTPRRRPGIGRVRPPAMRARRLTAWASTCSSSSVGLPLAVPPDGDVDSQRRTRRERSADQRMRSGLAHELEVATVGGGTVARHQERVGHGRVHG